MENEEKLPTVYELAAEVEAQEKLISRLQTKIKFLEFEIIKLKQERGEDE